MFTLTNEQKLWEHDFEVAVFRSTRPDEFEE